MNRLRVKMRTLLKKILIRTTLYDHIPQLGRIVDSLDPSLVVGLRSVRAPAPRIGLICVYRCRNAKNVHRILAHLDDRSLVALWAFEEATDDLREFTIGSGSGSRFELLNRCAHTLDFGVEDWLAILDDDVAFRRGTVTDAILIARAANLHLSQPAHTWTSYVNWAFTRRRPFVIARRGGFVEIGPALLLSPEGRRMVLPFPEAPGMGWGTEALWAALEAQGLHLGIIDAVLIDHLIPVGGTYDRIAEYEREQALLARHSVGDLPSLQRDIARWTVFRQLLLGRKPAAF